jgi:hypothetical protein
LVNAQTRPANSSIELRRFAEGLERDPERLGALNASLLAAETLDEAKELIRP